ncbi:Rv3235 family protein [Nocardioides sp. GY 10127]|uniref:Rv3235 family protein n=1 Tax=Nocardioides sp. GY 10127 TaxID=2569762 RepID=UPI0010A7E8C2|nr:Rv3235 family protein [Nocardioides sp. GY 10127]TIC84210.1 hypothetical protein E8D37_05320 [Nocardioides sp. GY 10127]
MTALPHALDHARPDHAYRHQADVGPAPVSPPGRRSRRAAHEPEDGYVPGPLEAFLLASLARDEQRAQEAVLHRARVRREARAAVEHARWRAGYGDQGYGDQGSDGAAQGVLSLDLGSRPPVPAAGYEPDEVARHEPPPPLRATARTDTVSGEAAVLPFPEGVAGCEDWGRRVVQAAVEIVHGSRPAAQLLRWSTAQVHADLVRRAQLVGAQLDRDHARALTPRPQVLSARGGYPTPGVLELAVRVRHGHRSRAVAARFERRVSLPPDRWLLTALDFA